MDGKPKHYLSQVLFSYHRNRLERSLLARYKAYRAEVIRFIQTNYPRHTVRAGEPVPSGSYQKKTDINTRFDMDLVVPFRHGYCQGPKGIKAEVFKTLQAKFQSDTTTVRNGKIAVCLQFLSGNHTIEVDVVPGMELKPGSYKDQSPDEEDKFLRLYNRVSNQELTTNVHRQTRLIRQNSERCRPAIQLLKIWKQSSGFRLSSYAIELMALEAFAKQKLQGKGSPDKLLLHLLHYMESRLKKDHVLIDIGTGHAWKDWLKPGGKCSLHGIWQQMTQALESGKQNQLEEFFPVNHKYQT